VKYIATILHIDIPRTARMQARIGEAVAKDTSQLLPGDLVTFGRGSSISHIGIYVGNVRFIRARTLRASAPSPRPTRARPSPENPVATTNPPTQPRVGSDPLAPSPVRAVASTRCAHRSRCRAGPASHTAVRRGRADSRAR